jgi:hypothetical protein
MLADKLIGTTCFGLLIAMMSAFNDEFRHKLVALASGGIVEEANGLVAYLVRLSNTTMENIAWYGGDHNWLLLTAMGAAVVGAVWMMKW